MANPDVPAAYAAPMDELLPLFIDQHRELLAAALDDLSESECRMALVPSKTTILGLVKHAIFVERVWFEEAVTGRSRAELGLPDGPDASFDLEPEDTAASVLADYRATVQRSREAVRGLSLDSELTGNRRGPLSLGWVYLHVLRELAQHCGHADILREQLLARRATSSAAAAELA